MEGHPERPLRIGSRHHIEFIDSGAGGDTTKEVHLQYAEWARRDDPKAFVMHQRTLNALLRDRKEAPSTKTGGADKTARWYGLRLR